ncbi:MAG: TetR/AcrR family transcriptional regulator [Elusimicrobiales bacterium]|nr:TetR/AcrR family transcriptional regulator [Elusimicrobiales bacterium]
MARPPGFNREKVLEKVMFLFWERGYAGASLSDIVSVTGLNKGSLYRSFGDKETLFRLALRRYSVRGPALMGNPEPSLDGLLRIYTRLIDDAAVPARRGRGCFLFNSGIEFGGRSGTAAREVAREFKGLEDFFRRSVAGAVGDGDLPPDLDKDAAAARAFSAAFTLREIARFRPQRRFLLEIANAALASLGTNRRLS